MSKIPTPKNKAQRKPFHDVSINVYPDFLPLSKIHFWKDNNRTIFTFDRLKRLKNKDISDIPIEEITQFIADQDIHKLQSLADSIGRNGVQVPLIIRDDGKLLDGNRRYFACQLLKMQLAEDGKSLPKALLQIPVLIIRKADLDKKETLELKILAEANFIPDLKLPWSLDAQARAVKEFYDQVKGKKGNDEETALAEVVSVCGISRQRARDLLGSLELTEVFIKDGESEDEKIRRRSIVEEKFVYFWEFSNKAMKGSGEYKDIDELKEVREMFFTLMAKGSSNPITNVKQVEPLVQAKREKTIWRLFKESNWQKVKVTVSAMLEKKEIRKADDKIRLFSEWLENINDLPPNAKKLLKELAQLATRKAQE